MEPADGGGGKFDGTGGRAVAADIMYFFQMTPWRNTLTKCCFAITTTYSSAIRLMNSFIYCDDCECAADGSFASLQAPS